MHVVRQVIQLQGNGGGGGVGAEPQSLFARKKEVAI